MKSVEVSIKELIVIYCTLKAPGALNSSCTYLEDMDMYAKGNVSGATEAVTEAVTATVAPKSNIY